MSKNFQNGFSSSREAVPSKKPELFSDKPEPEPFLEKLEPFLEKPSPINQAWAQSTCTPVTSQARTQERPVQRRAARRRRTQPWFSVPAAFQWNRPAAQVHSPYSASSRNTPWSVVAEEMPAAHRLCCLAHLSVVSMPPVQVTPD